MKIPEFFKQADKQAHLAGCFAMTMLLAFVLSSLAYAALAVLAAGIGKELYDRSRSGNRFSTADLVADVLGIALGACVVLLIRAFS